MKGIGEVRRPDLPGLRKTARQALGNGNEIGALQLGAKAAPADAFGARLAHSYRLLANDEDALEAAKAVVQVLPYFDMATTELRASSGAVMARAPAQTSRDLTSAAVASPLTLQIRLDGDAVDVAAWSPSSATLEQVLAAREELSQALARRGLRLRRFAAAEVPAEQPPPVSRLLDDPLYRRSYVEVIA